MPLPNVHLGVSVEDQPTADERIPLLLQAPAAVRFISYEPVLGAIDLEPWVTATCCTNHDHVRGICGFQGIDWVIAGGESGPNARPAHPDWFRSVRDQCQTAGVPFFFKQWGEWAPSGLYNFDGDLMKKVGRKAAGAMLDGREWKEYPE